jgi:L-fuculose-phosphate aldolase
MRFSLNHPRDQLVAIMNRVYRSGMIVLSGGSLFNKDDNGHMWITPSAPEKGALTAGEAMRDACDGLEVAEFSARSMIDTGNKGRILA